MPDPDAEEQRRAARKRGASERLSGIIKIPGAEPGRSEDVYMPHQFTDPITGGTGEHGTVSGRYEFPMPRISITNDDRAPIPMKRSGSPPYEDKHYIDRRRPR